MTTKLKRKPNTKPKQRKRSTHSAKKPKEMTEIEIHKKLVSHLQKLQESHFFAFFHVKNEYSRSERLRYFWSKEMGVVKGVPDFVFLLPGGVTSFLEIKSKKGKLSEHQKEFFKNAEKLNHVCQVAYGLEECIEKAESIIL